jgi:hypothetical protein
LVQVVEMIQLIGDIADEWFDQVRTRVVGSTVLDKPGQPQVGDQ